MSSNDENKFPRGVFLKDKTDNQPDFVVQKISLKPHDFFTWCQEHQDKYVKGWLNLVLMKSKAGNNYLIIDDWKPTEKVIEEQDTKAFESISESSNNKASVQMFGRELTPEEQANLSDIPF